jgi:hypothetical protein
MRIFVLMKEVRIQFVMFVSLELEYHTLLRIVLIEKLKVIEDGDNGRVFYNLTFTIAF